MRCGGAAIVFEAEITCTLFVVMVYFKLDSPIIKYAPRSREIRGIMESSGPSWYRVTLSNSDVVARRHMDLQKEFETLFLAHQWPTQAAMFASVDTLAHHFYFSPAAVTFSGDLIAHYGGTECAQPEVTDLVLLVGNPGWKEAIFPGESEARASGEGA
jgi:hypothetical protein